MIYIKLVWIFFILCNICNIILCYKMNNNEKTIWRNYAKDMFYHAYYNYMKYAYPWDELKPISCTGRKWTNKSRGDIDDTLGGYSLTLIDSLDMLAILNDKKEFKNAVDLILLNVHFKRNVNVSVFESTIRIIGGLLSAHMIASNKKLNFMPSYIHYTNKTLLDLAIDLADRLLPAFDTKTGIPEHRINLLLGNIKNDKNQTCPAAAGSLLVEFALLSRLSNRPIYEKKAKKAVLALWKRRSNLNLLGSTINIHSGQWIHLNSGIGAGFDSFYEYLFKYYILFGDMDFLKMFIKSYNAIELELNFNDWHFEVDMFGGRSFIHSQRISSLQAFWPGLQVLSGDVSSAIKSHRKLVYIWEKFGFSPESYTLYSINNNYKSNDRKIIGKIVPWGKNYPLRPELIESTYHLYIATKDDHYLEIGKNILSNIYNITKTNCGFAAIKTIENNNNNNNKYILEDRMDSFFLSETIKYLYLLFKNSTYDPILYSNNENNKNNKNIYSSDILLSTEGHLFFISEARKLQLTHSKVQTKKSKLYSSYKCENINKKPNVPMIKNYKNNSNTNTNTNKTIMIRLQMYINNIYVLEMEAFPADFGYRIHSENQLLNNNLTANLVILPEELNDACLPISSKDLNLKNSFVLVVRGKCSFSYKSKNLQRAGAKGVIIINNIDDTLLNYNTNSLSDKFIIPRFFISFFDRLSTITKNKGKTNYQRKIYKLLDDGNNFNIYIPVIMITKKDALYIYQYLDQYHHIFEQNGYSLKNKKSLHTIVSLSPIINM